MLRTIASFAIVTIVILAMIGCSQSQPMEPAPRDNLVEAGDMGDHVLWGYYKFYINPSIPVIEVVPARQASLHANVKPYVTPPACMDCVKVKPTGPYSDNILPVNITLKNPTPLTGYDVRGILLSDDPGATLSWPDDYTELFDNGGAININPFMAFAKGETNRAFGAGAENTELYQLYLSSFGKVTVIDYAVDASWPSRAKEPFSIEGPFQLGQLDSYGIVECQFEVIVFAANDDVDEVWLDLSELGLASELEMTNSYENTWEVYVFNENLVGEGEYKAWCRASTASSNKYLYSQGDIIVELGQAPVSLTDDIQPVFNANCATCHQSVAPPADLDLSAGNAYASIVDVDSTQGSTKIIKPLSTFESYLYAKLMGSHLFAPHDGSGDQMPKGGDPLEFTAIETIGNWIDQGALDN